MPYENELIDIKVSPSAVKPDHRSIVATAEKKACSRSKWSEKRSCRHRRNNMRTNYIRRAI